AAAGSQVVLTSTQVGNSRAIAEVHATGPFYITLDAGYDPGWGAHIEGLSGNPPLQHFEALGYANGWVVPRGGSLKIVMEYDGNSRWRLLLAGWILTTAVLVVIAVWPRRPTEITQG